MPVHGSWQKYAFFGVSGRGSEQDDFIRQALLLTLGCRLSHYPVVLFAERLTTLFFPIEDPASVIGHMPVPHVSDRMELDTMRMQGFGKVDERQHLR